MSEKEAFSSTSSANITGYEVTINIAHIAKYKQLTTRDQKLKIAHIFTCMINMIKFDYDKVVKSSRRVFELTEKGIVHLHAYICTIPQPTHTTHALCQDMARYLYKAVNKQFDRKEYYQPNKYYDQYIRYRAPLCTITYCDTEERFIQWNDYLSKEQKPNN